PPSPPEPSPLSLHDALPICPYQSALWMLMGAVGLLLAIACANVASLQIARGLARVQEFSIRAALGSGRSRLVSQVLVENLVLALDRKSTRLNSSHVAISYAV